MKTIFNLIVFSSLILSPMLQGANAIELEEGDIDSRQEIANQIIDLEAFLGSVFSLLLQKNEQNSAGLDFYDIVTNANLTKTSLTAANLKTSIWTQILNDLGRSMKEDFVPAPKKDPGIAARNSLASVIKRQNEITSIVRAMSLDQPTPDEIFERITLLCSAGKKSFAHSISEIHTFILMRLHKIFSNYLAIAAPAEGQEVINHFRRMLNDYTSDSGEGELLSHYLTQFTSQKQALRVINAADIGLALPILDLIVMYIGCLDALAPLEEELSLNDKHKRRKLNLPADDSCHPIIAFLEGESPKVIKTSGPGTIINMFRIWKNNFIRLAGPQ